MAEVGLYVAALCAFYLVYRVVDYLLVVQRRLAFMEGQFEVMRTVPVLRQYVKEFVPVEMTEERKKELEARMAEQEEQWSKMFGFANPDSPFIKPKNPDKSDFQPRVAKADLMNPSDLV